LANIVFPPGSYWMRKFGNVVRETAKAVEQASFRPPFGPAAV
jgi:hypothetical protein